MLVHLRSYLYTRPLSGLVVTMQTYGPISYQFYQYYLDHQPFGRNQLRANDSDFAVLKYSLMHLSDGCWGKLGNNSMSVS